MKRNVIQEKSYLFALSIIKLYQELRLRKEYELGKQVLRSGTSIGANIEESIGAQSDRDFFSKMNIAHKEARETYYWLRLLKDAEIISQKSASTLLFECNELIKLSASIITTIKKKNEKAEKP
ncbi:MAG: four helix bundle protein [Bacteroidales bacterium]